MAFEGDLVFASGRVPEKDLLCVRADGSGDVTETHVEWRIDKLITYVPSPLVHEGRLYVVNDDGIARCLDANTGKEFWKKRLGGKFSALLLLTAGKVFATNEGGTTFVFQAGPKYEMVSRNEIGEECLASPLIYGGRVFLRTSRPPVLLGRRGVFPVRYGRGNEQLKSSHPQDNSHDVRKKMPHVHRHNCLQFAVSGCRCR